MAFNIPEDFFSDEILQFFNDSDIIGTDTFSEELTAPEVDASSSSSSSVFASTTEKEIQGLLEKNKNGNTIKSTATWVKRFEKWKKEKCVSVDLPNISALNLNVVLQQYFAEIRNEKGEEYAPDSLRTMLSAMHRYIKGTGYSHNILTAPEFASAREVLNGKAIALRESGKEKRKRKADFVTTEDEQTMWNNGILGSSTPQNLNYTMFFLLSQNFGTRGCQEHHQIKIEDLKLIYNPSSGEALYVDWVEGPTKTRQGGLAKQERCVSQRMFAIGGDRCPVKIFQKLLNKRPEPLKSSGPLYLTPLQDFQGQADVWYSQKRMGINKINSFMKDMAKQSGLSNSNKRYTNHSVRKTMVHKLQKAGFSNDKIASISGHKSEQSLRDYSDIDMEDHQQISHTLSYNTRSDCQKLSKQIHSDAEFCSVQSTSLPLYNFTNCTVSTYYQQSSNVFTLEED